MSEIKAESPVPMTKEQRKQYSDNWKAIDWSKPLEDKQKKEEER